MSTEDKQKYWQRLDKFISDLRLEYLSIKSRYKEKEGKPTGTEEGDAGYHLDNARDILKKKDI